MIVTDATLARELLLMTDHHTDRLYSIALPGAATVVFPVSRLVVDPERFADDAHEPMAALGMGAVYRLGHDGAPLRPVLSEERRQALLARYYHPHHAALEDAVGLALESHGRCLVIDGHSFPRLPLPYENPQLLRPEICLGTDKVHTPARLLEAARAAFTRQGFAVEVDQPFSGALVPASRHRSDTRVLALMVEVRRDLYMDETTGSLHPDVDAFQTRLTKALRDIVA